MVKKTLTKTETAMRKSIEKLSERKPEIAPGNEIEKVIRIRKEIETKMQTERKKVSSMVSGIAQENGIEIEIVPEWQTGWEVDQVQ
jgi:hypothetical protein